MIGWALRVVLRQRHAAGCWGAIALMMMFAVQAPQTAFGDDAGPETEAAQAETEAAEEAGEDAATDTEAAESSHSESAFDDKPIPLMDPVRAERPKPLLELGNPFLGTGNIQPGIELPGGAVWQPSFLLFGTYRSAIQAFNDGETTRSEWANRLDIFGNLQLSPTERLLVGIRPLDQDNRFTGYNINGEPTGWEEEFNARITTLFFEGDFGEIFPDLDPHDRHALDWGFAVGRQPLSFQDGLLLNDRIDAIGIVRNNILPRGGSNLRATFLYGWDNIHRNDNERARKADIFGIFTESDWEKSTVQADFVFVHDSSDLPNSAHWGLGAIQRFGKINTAFRYLGSQSTGENVPAASSGHLLFSQVSWTPARTHDLMYVNAFLGIDDFASAARSPEVGGPLGNTGILFAAIGLGRYGAPLGNRVGDSVGGAIGYQLFLDDTRKQIIFEVGARQATGSEDDDATAAVGVRYQQALGKNFILQLDTFGSLQESRDPGYGGRAEIRYEF